MIRSFKGFLYFYDKPLEARELLNRVILEISESEVVEKYYSNFSGVKLIFPKRFPAFFVPKLYLSKVVSVLDRYHLKYLYYPVKVKISEDDDIEIIREGYFFRLLYGDSILQGCEKCEGGEEVLVKRNGKFLVLKVGSGECFFREKLKRMVSLVKYRFLKKIYFFDWDGGFFELTFKNSNSYDSLLFNLNEVMSYLSEGFVYATKFYLNKGSYFKNFSVSFGRDEKSYLSPFIKEGYFKRFLGVITEFCKEYSLKNFSGIKFSFETCRDELVFCVCSDWFSLFYMSLKFKGENILSMLEKFFMLAIAGFLVSYQKIKEKNYAKGVYWFFESDEPLLSSLESKYKKGMSDRELIELAKDLIVAIKLVYGLE